MQLSSSHPTSLSMLLFISFSLLCSAGFVFVVLKSLSPLVLSFPFVSSFFISANQTSPFFSSFVFCLYIFPFCFFTVFLLLFCVLETEKFQKKLWRMSSRRSGQSRSSTSRVISDDQILDLVSKLRQFVPEIRHSQSSKLSASKFLQETCNYIRGLQREVDDLSERLSRLLSTIDADSAEASIITSLITN